MGSWPLGTPEEVIAAGFPLSKTPCCAPQKSIHEHEGTPQEAGGCPFWIRGGPDGAVYECSFKNPKRGGFRGKGPRNVGVFVRLDKAEVVPGEIRPAAATHVMPCYLFESALRDRYEQQRRTGETITIVAQEGEKMPHVVQTLVPDKSPEGYKRQYALDKEFVVPKHPRIGDSDPMTELEKMVAARELENMDAEQEARERAELKAFAGDMAKRAK